jgi:hypothetical protein
LLSDIGFLLSEHRVGVDDGLSDRLDHVALFDDLDVLQPEDVDDVFTAAVKTTAFAARSEVVI